MSEQQRKKDGYVLEILILTNVSVEPFVSELRKSYLWGQLEHTFDQTIAANAGAIANTDWEKVLALAPAVFQATGTM